jgi:hypothetical protein
MQKIMSYLRTSFSSHIHLRSVPESYRDLLVPAHRNELDHAAPKMAIKVTDSFFLTLEVSNEVRQPLALRFLDGDGGYDHIVQRLCVIISSYNPVIAFPVFFLILRNAGVLLHEVLRHFHKHRHFFIQLALFFLQGSCDAERFANDLRIGDDLFPLGDQLVVRRYKRRLDLFLRDMGRLALLVVNINDSSNIFDEEPTRCIACLLYD